MPETVRLRPWSTRLAAASGAFMVALGFALVDESETEALRDCYASLTPRERAVMMPGVSGMLNKLVGLKLGISEITVKAHRGKMMLKMKADSLAELVKMSVRLGLAPATNPWHVSREP